jgi:hypothetical protein
MCFSLLGVCSFYFLDISVSSWLINRLVFIIVRKKFAYHALWVLNVKKENADVIENVGLHKLAWEYRSDVC